MALSTSATRLQPIAREQERPRVVARPTAVVETDVSSNPIAKTVLDPSLKDDQKVATLTKTITADTLSALHTFTTYLAEKRTAAQRRLLELTSTTAFPRLQAVIGSLQNGVVDFDKMMQPMTDDLQAAYDLRTNGKMNDAVREIAEDREKEADWNKRRQVISDTLRSLRHDAERLKFEIVGHQNDKNFFGYVKGPALQAIAEKTARVDEIEKKLIAIRSDDDALNAEVSAYNQRTVEFKAQKERLRKMLDLGPGYVKRVEDIVATAIKFIDDSSKEVGGIREEFDALESQARNVLKANAQMVHVTAILDQGIDGANNLHVARVKELDVAPPNEDILSRVTRTQEKNDLERFVTALTDTRISTKKTVSALEEDAVGANNFTNVVTKQQTNLRELHGDGIASITTNLNMALQAFNTAALTEAGNNAWQAIGDMNRVTNKIRDNEVVASAMSLDDTNQRIVDRFASLDGVSEALKEANRIRSDGIKNIASSLQELADKTKEVQANLQVNIGLDAAGPGVRAETSSSSKKSDDLMLGA